MAIDGVNINPLQNLPRSSGTGPLTAPAEAPATEAPGAAPSVSGDSSQFGTVGAGSQLGQAGTVEGRFSEAVDPFFTPAYHEAKDITPIVAPGIEATAPTDPPAGPSAATPTPTPTEVQAPPTTRPPETVSMPPAPPAPPPEQVIEVAGSGMGADKSFKMYPSELAAVYAILKQGGVMSLEEMQKQLSESYGIDTKIENGTLINTENGHALIADTNGNGALDMGDMNFEAALSAAGIDPSSIPGPGEHKKVDSLAYWSNYWGQQLVKEMEGSSGGPSDTPEDKGPAKAGSAKTPVSGLTKVGGIGDAQRDLKMIEVKGGDDLFKMYGVELFAMYATLKQEGKPVSLDELKDLLKKEVGIDCDIQQVNGKDTLVNKLTGNALIADTDGSGKIDLKDLNFEDTLRGAGYHPEDVPAKAPESAAK